MIAEAQSTSAEWILVVIFTYVKFRCTEAVHQLRDQKMWLYDCYIVYHKEAGKQIWQGSFFLPHSQDIDLN